MAFLPASLVKRTNDYVASQPADRNPRFKRGVGLNVAGGILRYSTETPPSKVVPIPGGYRVLPTP